MPLSSLFLEKIVGCNVTHRKKVQKSKNGTYQMLQKEKEANQNNFNKYKIIIG
jgi:hypothetical protein